MKSKFKDIDIKKLHILLFDDIINTENFDPNKIEINEKSYKNILTYCIDM